MLPKDLEKRLVNQYLNSYATALQAEATGQEFTGTEADTLGLSKLFDDCAKGHLAWEKETFATADQYEGSSDTRAISATMRAEMFKLLLASKSTMVTDGLVQEVAKRLKKNPGIKLTDAECKSLALQLNNADKVVHEVESAMLRGEWSPLELLQQKIAKGLETPYYDLKTVLAKYREHYLNSKPNVAEGTRKDMLVECRVLLEIMGNVGISDFNSMDSVTKLKGILLKYPLNKQQRYGDKSIHAILKSEKLYEKISLKTANTYLDRAKDVVRYAGKHEMLNKSANVYEGERFAVAKAAQEDRAAYDSADVARLIDAICTQPLQGQSTPYPERFWIILIALFHGLRLGNIVELTKEDICQTDRGLWIFDLRRGKTKATVRPVAICDTLLLLGFLEWVEQLPRKKLFQDSSRSFSAWYNRDEVNKKTGQHFRGFESRYVTTDKKKCLYSIRHHFAGNVFEVTEDFMVTSNMLGHSTEQKVGARYIKATKAKALKEVTDKMRMDIDLDMLEARAQELFFK
ncbi:tyrosine-type recombinase/integrase [Geomonas subterranea]|uniref:Tyrosine-type recombinase/integrase n=1 Tax=Geomonas subterranea TaxID=2847989 RepID=A0ABX8LI54_9BACT|nr:tyrosine-type recombinase/integrase [Geomonas subterranea]QXE91642.1 tyrosine-type recombinase/integrase [Geomonas subterranea]QXM10266.1 tyrosine-type recombinase/integrase [Geomonas subterranea]